MTPATALLARHLRRLVDRGVSLDEAKAALIAELNDADAAEIIATLTADDLDQLPARGPVPGTVRKAKPARNRILVYLTDADLAHLDIVRGETDRSSYLRSLIASVALP